MIEPSKRIRDSAPFRKSMSMSSDDVFRADELERIFTSLYPDECPFSFSKTISKALEIALSAVQDSQDSSRRPQAHLGPELPPTQETLCAADEEQIRPPSSEKHVYNVTESRKGRSSRVFGKRKGR